MRLPPTWAEALGKVQELMPDAVIAGGALRDMILGRPVKDIDVFAYRRTWRTATELKAWLQAILGGTGKIVINEAYATYREAIDSVVFAVEVSAFNITGLPFQVIAMDHPVTMQSAVERIDLGMCRVAHNGKELYQHPDFIHDRANECFTIRRCNNVAQLERTKERYTRLQVKYMGWPLKV